MSHTSYTHNLGPSHFPTPNPQARVLPVAVCPHPKDAPRHAMTQAHLKCVNHSICSSYSCIIIIWRYLVTPSIISVPSFLKLRFSPSFIYSSSHCNSSYILTIAVVGKLRSGGSGDRLPSPRRIFIFIFISMIFEKFMPAVGPTQSPVQWIKQGSVVRPQDDAARSSFQGMKLWMNGAIPFLPPYTVLPWIGKASPFVLQLEAFYPKLSMWCIKCAVWHHCVVWNGTEM